jgi:phage FluMu protein Com
MEDVRCKKCNKLLGKIGGPYEIKCPRCGTINDNVPPSTEIIDAIYAACAEIGIPPSQLKNYKLYHEVMMGIYDNLLMEKHNI